MSQHPSLKSGSGDSAFRSVLKRHEKIKELTEKEKWNVEKDSVYKLPKVKRVKFKIKKAKSAAEEEGAEGVAGAPAAPGAAGAPAAAAAPSGGAKPAKK